MTAMLEIEGLVKHFGPIVAVDGITFTVGKGEVLGFLGPNGAGKSTTMKVITGFLRADAGRVRVCGDDVEEAPLETRKRIGYLPEGAPLYSDMTPRQFLAFIASVRGLERERADQAIARAVEKVSLESVLDQAIDTLSKGFKRRVGLAQAILPDPDILILDEPTDGLDPNQKHDVRELIRQMSRDKAIVISTHLLEEVEAVCSRAVIIDKGRIVADGTPAELLARSRFHNAVSLVLDGADAAQARAALEALDGVDRVEQADGGEARFTVFPKGGKAIAGEVSGMVRSAGWHVSEFHVEAGRLDEVFRGITTGDVGPTGNGGQA